LGNWEVNFHFLSILRPGFTLKIWLLRGPLKEDWRDIRNFKKLFKRAQN